MVNLKQTVLTFANGETKVIGSKVHAFIASHPVTATLIALGVGVVAGLVLRGL